MIREVANAVRGLFGLILYGVPEPPPVHPDRVSFERHLAEWPKDVGVRGAYADWLYEHGEIDESARQRRLALRCNKCGRSGVFKDDLAVRIKETQAERTPGAGCSYCDPRQEPVERYK